MGVSASMQKSPKVDITPLKVNFEFPPEKKNEPEKRLLHYQKLSNPPYDIIDNDKPGNPGTWDELHKKVLDICPKSFEGLKLVKTRKLSKHFSVNHSLILSRKVQTGYRFGATFNGTKRIGPNERYPSLSATIMTDGSMDASFINTIGNRGRFKVKTQIDEDSYKVDYGLDYRSDDFTIAANLLNVSRLQHYEAFNLQYLQAVSPRIAVGTEISCKNDPNYPLGVLSNMSGAFRYSTGRRTISAIFGGDGLHMTYHHIASRELELGVEIKTDLETHKSEAAIAYKFNCEKMDAVIHGFVTTEAIISTVFEKKLHPISDASLLLSAYLDHKAEIIRVGIGLNI